MAQGLGRKQETVSRAISTHTHTLTHEIRKQGIDEVAYDFANKGRQKQQQHTHTRIRTHTMIGHDSGGMMCTEQRQLKMHQFYCQKNTNIDSPVTHVPDLPI